MLNGKQFLNYLRDQRILISIAKDLDAFVYRIRLEQDDAPQHYACPLRKYVDKLFPPSRWNDTEWPQDH